MSTIHTAMTGKSDSLIDAVRDSEDKDMWSITIDKAYIFPTFANAVETDLHPDHPDYMRMVVHQMD